MLQNKKRKEVLLDEETIELLEIQAKKQGRKLKNYMEFVLKEKAIDFELTNDYKVMMDEVLEKEKKGELNFLTKEEFRKRLAR